MATQQKQISEVLEELKNAAKVEYVDALGEKVDRCFSEDRFEHFQEKVEQIVLKTLGHKDGQKEIKETSTIATKEYLEKSNAEKLKFWLPTIISLLAAGCTIYIAFFKHS